MTVVVVMLLTLPFEAKAEEKVFRIGMIGLDTSHVTAFTKLINNPAKNYGCKVVVGYAGSRRLCRWFAGHSFFRR